jgi:hypothetical protein
LNAKAASVFCFIILSFTVLFAALPTVEVHAQSQITTYDLPGVAGGMALDTTNHNIYIPNNNGYVSVFSSVSDTLVGNISVGPESDGAPASLTNAVFDNATGMIYVEDALSFPALWEIDPTTNAVVGNVNVTAGGYPGGLTYANGVLYLSDTTGKVVYAISGQTNKVLDNVSVWANPANSAFDPQNGYLYVTAPLAEAVMIVDAPSHSVVANITVPNQPLAIGYGGGTVFVTEYASNATALINPATSSIMNTVVVGQTNVSAPSRFVVVPGTDTNATTPLCGPSGDLCVTGAVGNLATDTVFVQTFSDYSAIGPSQTFDLPYPANALLIDSLNLLVYATAQNSIGQSYLYALTLTATSSSITSASQSNTSVSHSSTASITSITSSSGSGSGSSIATSTISVTGPTTSTESSSTAGAASSSPARGGSGGGTTTLEVTAVVAAAIAATLAGLAIQRRHRKDNAGKVVETTFEAAERAASKAKV